MRNRPVPLIMRTILTVSLVMALPLALALLGINQPTEGTGIAPPDQATVETAVLMHNPSNCFIMADGTEKCAAETTEHALFMSDPTSGFIHVDDPISGATTNLTLLGANYQNSATDADIGMGALAQLEPQWGPTRRTWNNVAEPHQPLELFVSI